ncbi:MAG: hypothetical protein NTZ19_01705 [Bacteroidetes bacterium]|nr:hypothetical protein [Bacteroidota bacterium]
MSSTDSYNKNINFFGTVLVLLFLSPLWLFLIWFSFPKKKMVVAIVDKTVLTTAGQEHVSFNWILLQEKFTKTNKELYDQSQDYYGFFPGTNKNFELKGLERFSSQQLDKLSEDADLAYITDAYGIYKNEWYEKGDEKERSGIVYGGMSDQDIEFLSGMKNKHKLVISEFNCLGSPTSPIIRLKFQEVFGIGWTGWIGRYFDSFDTTINKELPKWLIRNYKAQHRGAWPFKKSGVAFVHSDDRVVILEKDIDLIEEYPKIVSNQEGQSGYKLPKKLEYTFWFDIVEYDKNVNHTIADFNINATDRGIKILEQSGIPSSFPAITLHNHSDYQFYYFSADFSDNPIDLRTAYLKFIPKLSRFFYNRRDPMDRKAFFWEIYQPLVTTILKNNYKKIKGDHLDK